MAKKDPATCALERIMAWNCRIYLGSFQGGSLCLVTHENRVDVVHEWEHAGRLRKEALASFCGFEQDRESGARNHAEWLLGRDQERSRVVTKTLSIAKEGKRARRSS